MKIIIKIIIIFVIGMTGGILSGQLLWPYFVDRPFFYQNQTLPKTPAKITEKKEVVIEENSALQNAIEKVGKIVVGVETKTKTGKIISGSGIIITSDGLMVTLAELIPPEPAGSHTFFIDGKTQKYQILKRDLKNNLALVKIEGSDFPTCSFADFGKTKLGERIFLVGVIPGEKQVFLKSVNEGIIKLFNDKYIETNIIEKNNLKGSPLFNIKGELLGLNTVNKNGEVFSIPIVKIRDFIGF